MGFALSVAKPAASLQDTITSKFGNSVYFAALNGLQDLFGNAGHEAQRDAALSVLASDPKKFLSSYPNVLSVGSAFIAGGSLDKTLAKNVIPDVASFLSTQGWTEPEIKSNLQSGISAYSDKTSGSDFMSSIAVPVALGLATGGAGAALGTSLGIGSAAGTALVGAGLGALQGQDLNQIATNAVIGGTAGALGSSIGSEVGNQTVGQLSGGTTAGLLRGQDLETALTNAATNVGASQAINGLVSAATTPSPVTTTDFTAGADYSAPSVGGGLGLKAEQGSGTTLFGD